MRVLLNRNQSYQSAMSFLASRSLLIEYWEFCIPVALLVYYLLRKRSHQKPYEEEYIADSYKVGEAFNDDELTPSLEDGEHISFEGAKVTMPGGVEEFYKLTNDRRSVRSFSSKPVSFETIKYCIKAAGTAPSGAHTEPWTFCVVSDGDLKSKIRAIVEAEEYLNYSQRMHRQWTTDLKPLKTDHNKQYLTEAPYLILVFKQTYGYREDGRRKQHYYNEISVSIATGILITAFQAAGLSSLVTTPLNCGPALRKLLGRPQNEKLLVLLPVGYPSDDCTIPDLKRKNVDEILVKF